MSSLQCNRLVMLYAILLASVGMSSRRLQLLHAFKVHCAYLVLLGAMGFSLIEALATCMDCKDERREECKLSAKQLQWRQC
jgi:hypothetical protein